MNTRSVFSDPVRVNGGWEVTAEVVRGGAGVTSNWTKTAVFRDDEPFLKWETRGWEVLGMHDGAIRTHARRNWKLPKDFWHRAVKELMGWLREHGAEPAGGWPQ